MSSRESVLQAFRDISVWSRGDERAPHKPLLILLALGRLSRGEPNSFAYDSIDKPLADLLREFGPVRKSYHPELPFWRLQRDGLWVVEDEGRFQRRTGSNDIPRRELLAQDAHGHFPTELATRLQQEPALRASVARLLLESHFPPSLHEDILDAVGLDFDEMETVARRKRDPSFRHRVLTAYEHACAVCGFDVRLGQQTIGLEAAHIKWHQAGGPSEESNGLALCSLHHKAFDLGAFTLNTDRALCVSEQVHGRQGFDEWLLRYHGRPIRSPIRGTYIPATPFLDWHHRQVFKHPSRELDADARGS